MVPYTDPVADISPAQKALWSNALADRLEQLGLKQRELGERAGIKSPETVRRMLRPDNPTMPEVSTLRSTCQAVGWTPDSWQLIIDGQPPVESDEIPPGDRDDLLRDEIAQVRIMVTELADAMDGLVQALHALPVIQAAMQLNAAGQTVGRVGSAADHSG